MTTKTERKTTETKTSRSAGMTGEERTRLASLRLVTERYRARNDRLERCLATSFRQVEREHKP